MRLNLLASLLLLSSVLLQETLMSQLQLGNARADLVLIMVVGWSFLLPPHALEPTIFFTGLLQGLIELPLVNSLGLYPLSYLCIAMLFSRLLASHFPPSLVYRFPLFIAAFIVQRIFVFLAQLLLEPGSISLAQGLLKQLADAGYSTLLWALLSVLLFHPLESRVRL